MPREEVSHDRLCRILTERLHARGVDAQVTKVDELTEPDADACTWSSDLIFRLGPSEDLPTAIVDEVVREVRARYNLMPSSAGNTLRIETLLDGRTIAVHFDEMVSGQWKAWIAVMGRELAGVGSDSPTLKTGKSPDELREWADSLSAQDLQKLADRYCS